MPGLGRLQRDPAGGAAAVAEKLEPGPAIGAEAVHLFNDRAAPPAARRQREIERPVQTGAVKADGAKRSLQHVNGLSRSAARRTSARVSKQLFDPRLRALRRDRAARTGAELFLYERAFDDILDRLSLVRRRFGRALLIGCPDPAWKRRLQAAAEQVDCVDPGPLFARAAGGRCVVEDSMELDVAGYELCVAIGTLDSVNDLPTALATVRFALKPDSFFIGALGGGEMLPQLRSAMRAADREGGVAAPHVHPRIEASALASLLSASGFAMPVIDVDQVKVAYSSISGLVHDLRAMGATNILKARSPEPLTRRAAASAAAHFAAAAGPGGKTVEQFEILHFAAWTPAADGQPAQG